MCKPCAFVYMCQKQIEISPTVSVSTVALKKFPCTKMHQFEMEYILQAIEMKEIVEMLRKLYIFAFLHMNFLT